MTCANHPEIEATAFCRECGKPMCAECQRPALGSIYCGEHVMAAVNPAFAGLGAANPGNVNPGGVNLGGVNLGSVNAGAANLGVPPAPAVSAPPFPYHPSPYSTPVPYAPGVPPIRPAKGSSSPALAFILGFLIPGVGAIYNGQYAKGLVHAVIFGVLVSVLDASHHSALAPLLGIFLAVWMFYMGFEAFHTAKKRRLGIFTEEFSSLIDMKSTPGRFPVGAILLVGVGFILLLDTTDILNIGQLQRYWPVGLILLGLYLLYNRLNPGSTPAAPVAAVSSNPEVRQ